MQLFKLLYEAQGYTPRQKTKKPFQVSQPVQAQTPNPLDNELITQTTTLHGADKAFIVAASKAVTLPFWRNEEFDIDDRQGSAIDWD